MQYKSATQGTVGDVLIAWLKKIAQLETKMTQIFKIYRRKFAESLYFRGAF